MSFSLLVWKLDFKLQEDKLQPLIKRLCPLEEPSLPLSALHTRGVHLHTQTQVKTETKKHARWKLWFL